MTVSDLRDILRRIPPIAPDDSAARAVRLMRSKGVPAVLVADGSRLVGLVTEADAAALATAPVGARDALRETTVAELMQPPPLIVVEDQELVAVAQALRMRPTPAVPVVAADGRYLGLLLPRDMLAAMAGEPVVPPIAGLATPLGVYLTTGALRAGAGDLALAATGAVLMVLNLVAMGLGGLAARALRPALAVLPAGLVSPVGADAIGLVIIQLLLFLVLLRLSPLTGIHAAEHMVVRAIEEGEDLVPEKVRRMPRVHPRCGTNLMALVVLVAGAVYWLYPEGARTSDTGDVALVPLVVLLIVVVALTWRRLGAGLQRWITTKRPSDRQLAGAIAVGEALLARVEAQPSAVAGPLTRVWHTGFVQVGAGFFAVALAVEYGSQLVVSAWHLLAG